MAEQELRVGTITDNGIQFSNPIRTDHAGDGEVVSEELHDDRMENGVERDDLRLLAVKTNDNNVIEKAQVINPDHLDHKETAKKYSWRPDQSARNQTQKGSEAGSFAVIGKDGIEEQHGVTTTNDGGLDSVSTPEDLNRAPQDGVVSSDEIARRVSDQLEIEDGGKMVYEHDNKNDYGDVLESEVNQAMFGTDIKGEEDYAYPDHPRIAAESKLYSKDTDSIGIGAHNPADNEVIKSNQEYSEDGKQGKVVYTGADNEVELTSQDVRYVVAFNNKDAVTRENISKSDAEQMISRQDLSETDVFGRELSAEERSRIESDVSEWRESLAGDFVDRVGRVDSGVVISGYEIATESRGGISATPGHKYGPPGAFNEESVSERAKENPLGSDPNRPENN